MATRIKNLGVSGWPLPAPWRGHFLSPGGAVVTSLAIADVRTRLALSGSGNKFIRLTETEDAPTSGLDDGLLGVSAEEIGYTPAVTGDYPGTDPTEVKAALDRLAARTNGQTYGRTRAADAAAADVTAESLIERVLRPGTIVAVRYIPTAALTASDTDYATITVRQRDAAGANPATIATLVTNVAGGSWTAFVAKSLGAITNAALAAGAILTFEIAKTGNGVVVPDGRLEVVTEPASGA